MTGELIKNYLDENGIKYSYVAHKAGISLTTFSTMLNNKRKISAEEFIDICVVLRVKPNYFADKIKQVV